MNQPKPTYIKISIALFVFCFHTQTHFSQSVQNYIAEIECVNGIEHSTTLQNPSYLENSSLSSDTIVLNADTLYSNRKINFTLLASFCEDLSLTLNDTEKELQYGFRIIEDNVSLILAELIIEGPFQGVTSQGTIITIPLERTSISTYALEFNEGEFSFYLNDVLVLRSCIADQGLNFKHILIPSSNTNATISLTFESF